MHDDQMVVAMVTR